MGKTCSCIKNQGALLPGVDKDACCSGTANSGVCACAFAGRPAWSNVSTGSECCASYQKDGVGGCKESAAQNTPQGICCGGFLNTSDDGTKCRCIPDGTTVAPFVKASACCSGQIADGICVGTSANSLSETTDPKKNSSPKKGSLSETTDPK